MIIDQKLKNYYRNGAQRIIIAYFEVSYQQISPRTQVKYWKKHARSFSFTIKTTSFFLCENFGNVTAACVVPQLFLALSATGILVPQHEILNFCRLISQSICGVLAEPNLDSDLLFLARSKGRNPISDINRNVHFVLSSSDVALFEPIILDLFTFGTKMNE